MLRINFRWIVVSLVFATSCATTSNRDKDVSIDKNQMIGNFSLRSLSGDQVRLQDYSGKVVLLSFWASWCEPCQLELPPLQDIWERNRDRGFELLTIAVDPPDSENSVRQLVSRYRYRFLVLLDNETEVVNRFNPKLELPYSVLIDRAGRIAAVHQGYVTGDETRIEQEVQDLLNK